MLVSRWFQFDDSNSFPLEVSPQQFCWACICFLSTLLVVQAMASLDIRSWPMFLMDVPWRICASVVSRKVCVLVSLLRLVSLCIMCRFVFFLFFFVRWIESMCIIIVGLIWIEHNVVKPNKDVENQTIIRLKCLDFGDLDGKSGKRYHSNQKSICANWVRDVSFVNIISMFLRLGVWLRFSILGLRRLSWRSDWNPKMGSFSIGWDCCILRPALISYYNIYIY